MPRLLVTETQTVDLAAWLSGIWDEEERLAKACIDVNVLAGMRRGIDPPRWVRHGMAIYDDRAYGSGAPVLRVQHSWPREIDHIVLHDPVSVLARIAADRAVLAEFVARDNDVDLMLGPDCLRQREWSGLRLAIRLKAEQYKDRPGFNPEWLDRSQGSRSHP
jgi:hypothetical protein